MLASPANSGWATSTPESTIVIGLPGPGGREAVDADRGPPPLGRDERVAEIGHAHAFRRRSIGRREAERVAGPDPWQHPRGGVAVEPVEPQARRDRWSRPRRGGSRPASHAADGLSSTSCGVAEAAGAPDDRAATASNASAAQPAPSTRCARPRPHTEDENRCAVGGVPDEPAVPHREPPRRPRREGVVVRGDDHGGVVAAREPGEQIDHVGTGLGVEVAGRLVGENHPRADDERPRDRDALLLPAREVRREDARSDRPVRPPRAVPAIVRATPPSLPLPVRAPPRRFRARSASESG